MAMENASATSSNIASTIFMPLSLLVSAVAQIHSTELDVMIATMIATPQTQTPEAERLSRYLNYSCLRVLLHRHTSRDLRAV